MSIIQEFADRMSPDGGASRKFPGYGAPRKAGSTKDLKTGGTKDLKGAKGAKGAGAGRRFGAEDFFFAALLVLWGFFVNRGLRISGLYMDDLYLWSCFGEQSFREFVFPFGSTRCRFVYWFASWIELLLIGNHLEWIVPLNILLNAGIAVYLYHFSGHLSGSRTAGFLCGAVFLASRFAYYQVGQLLGLMETMGTFFAIVLVRHLFHYMHGEDRSFAAALIFWFLNCFVHERYMVLLPMFWFCMLVRKEKKPLRIASPAVLMGAVLLIRRLMIGTLSPAGTGGTQIADTITLRGTLVNYLVELLYLFGVNAGPEHLNGLPWPDTPFGVKLVIAASVLVLAVLSAVLASGLIGRRRAGLPILPVVMDFLFFLFCLLGAALSSAVTIRVEMRWIYVLLALLLLLISCMIGRRKEYAMARDKDPEAVGRFMLSDRLPVMLLFLFALLTIPVQLYMRTFFPKIYLFPNQARYNSLADETYGVYGPDILGRDIVIIGNSYEMSTFTAETFFKTFDPERTGQGTTVRHVDSAMDTGQVTDRTVVLKEVPEHNRFVDVTEIIRELQLSPQYGYYKDGWMDEKAEVRLLTGESGEIAISCMYPGNLDGTERIRIRARGAVPDDAARTAGRAVAPDTWELPLTSNIQTFGFHSDPHRFVEFTFSQNFYVENAAEQRGSDRLSMIVTFKAE